MTTTETNELNDLWKAVQDYRDKADAAFARGQDLHATYYRQQAANYLALIHLICPTALAVQPSIA